MARVFVTGSSQGLGLMAAELLAEQGHRVVLHARNAGRARAAREALPGAEDVLVGDLSTIGQMRAVAEQANAAGPFDAIIHNAALGYREPSRVETEDRLSRLFAVNVLAPYLLTALINPPRRLVYLSSGLHRSGSADLSDPQWEGRPWRGAQAYSDSKLFDVLLAFAVARRWPAVRSNALEPGWVATRMGGAGAPDDLSQGHLTQAWLAAGDDPDADVTGQYFYHQRLREPAPVTRDVDAQEALLDYCAKISGTSLP